MQRVDEKKDKLTTDSLDKHKKQEVMGEIKALTMIFREEV